MIDEGFATGNQDQRMLVAVHSFVIWSLAPEALADRPLILPDVVRLTALRLIQRVRDEADAESLLRRIVEDVWTWLAVPHHREVIKVTAEAIQPLTFVQCAYLSQVIQLVDGGFQTAGPVH